MKAIIYLSGQQFLVSETTTHAELCSDIATRVRTFAANMDIELELCKMDDNVKNSFKHKLDHYSAERVWDSMHLEEAIYMGVFRPLHSFFRSPLFLRISLSFLSPPSFPSPPPPSFPSPPSFLSPRSFLSPPSLYDPEINTETQWVPTTTSMEAQTQIQLDGWRQQEIEPILPVLSSRQKHTISLVASLRQLTGQSSFASKKFLGKREEMETAAVVLNAMLSSKGVHMSLNNNSGSFSTSVASAIMGGTTDFGGIHMLLYPIYLAQFIVKAKAIFVEVTSSPAAKASFARQFEVDVASMLRIPPGHVSVQELARGSVLVKFVIKGESEEEAKLRADILQQRLQDFYGPTISASHNCSYKFVPVFHKYQLSQTHFNAGWNRDYFNYKIQPSTEDRGGCPFFQPAGWYRHALRVSEKYGDESWLGMSNAPGEWPVAYHGTKAYALINIMQNGLLPGKSDAYKDDAIKAGAPRDSAAIYVAPDVEICDRYEYAQEFEIDVMAESGGFTKAGYKIAFMCRVNPNTVTKHHPNRLSGTSLPLNEPAYWRVWDPNGIRPYGLLLKQTK